MHVIGLTGGIGSGKTAVSDLFKALGVHVSDADQAARDVVAPKQIALAKIADYFGTEFIGADGSLDRARMREAVFQDKAKRAWLEQLLHPLIEALINQEIGKAQGNYAILSSALLFESGQNKMTTRTLVVDISEERQLSRAMARDNNTEEQIRAIMRAQLGRKERLERADDILDNNNTLEETRHQVLHLHQKYLQL